MCSLPQLKNTSAYPFFTFPVVFEFASSLPCLVTTYTSEPSQITVCLTSQFGVGREDM